MSWDPIDLSTLGDRPKITPDISESGLIYPGKRHLISGEPESGKTLFAYIVAIEVIRAEGKVALLDFEMGQWDARDRLYELGATDEELSGGLAYRQPETEPTKDNINDLIASKPTFVLIDAAAGAYEASGLDDGKRKDAEAWAAAWVRPLWKADIGTSTIDHVVKNADNRGNYAIGSERKVGAVDVHLGFEAIVPLRRGSHGLYKVSIKRDRAGYLPRGVACELELVSDPETHAITWTFKQPSGDQNEASGEAWRPTVLMDRVLEHVAEPWYEPLTRSALAGAVRGKREYLLKAIDYLLADEALRLDQKKVVPVPRNVPGTSPKQEGNGNVPRSLSLQGERFPGTLSGTER